MKTPLFGFSSEETDNYQKYINDAVQHSCFYYKNCIKLLHVSAPLDYHQALKCKKKNRSYLSKRIDRSVDRDVLLNL